MDEYSLCRGSIWPALVVVGLLLYFCFVYSFLLLLLLSNFPPSRLWSLGYVQELSFQLLDFPLLLLNTDHLAFHRQLKSYNFSMDRRNIIVFTGFGSSCCCGCRDGYSCCCGGSFCCCCSCSGCCCRGCRGRFCCGCCGSCCFSCGGSFCCGCRGYRDDCSCGCTGTCCCCCSGCRDGCYCGGSGGCGCRGCRDGCCCGSSGGCSCGCKGCRDGCSCGGSDGCSPVAADR